MRPDRLTHLVVVALMAAGTVVGLSAPAQSAARVSVSNDQGSAAADPKYATTLTLSGKGFQSIKGGHGGVYVFFGTVKSGWQPSKGGQTGRDYLYVPDSESRNNQGFQRFVAYPGSDTASSANGGTISAGGTWKTKLTVPGKTFKAVDRNGKARTVDCGTSRCGIITIGAHGVKNARNETFTPITFKDLYDGGAPSSSQQQQAPTAAAPDAAAPSAAAPSAPQAVGKPTLTVDRATAVAGRAMTFNATGLASGDQVVVSLDDGLAAVGPLSVGPNGQVAGSLKLPADLESGTHVLKLTGSAQSPTVTFAVRGAIEPASAETGTPWAPITFAALCGVALLAALVFSAVRLRSIRKAAADA